ncbi:thermonuclease family protein [Sphingomonas sp. 35-24ZXX]|uniref:thermonuclease family protein n=1 Tax=Sphingomonas sp. 35-24ZXX TaxID=1545915 RepID=UPI000691CC72|nr:thermonuclease family protein [Sphingomonas sp. 35-24ZXX]
MIVQIDRILAYLFMLGMILTAKPLFAQSVTGVAQVSDGDSLVIAGHRIRLFGIDAPELSQTCSTNAAAWACGESAKRALEGLVDGQTIACQVQGYDQYERGLAVCSTEFLSLNEAMVELGWALAYTQFSADYLDAQNRAKDRRAGLWASTFTPPWEYRTGNASQEQQRERETARPARRNPPALARHTGGCTIKGNRSRRGEWIYHLPGMPYYDVTRPEEIFCSEDEARAAGYRRAIVRP